MMKKSTVEVQQLQSINKYMDLLNERTEQLEWMMSEYTGNVYISDMETYELLYIVNSKIKITKKVGIIITSSGNEKLT